MATGRIAWAAAGAIGSVGRIAWAELGNAAPAAAAGRVAWAQVAAVAPVASAGRIAWAEVAEVLPAGSVGRIAWAEVNVAVAPGGVGRIGWAEVAAVNVLVGYVLECLPGVFESQGAPALADFEMDLGVGAFSSTPQEANLVLGDDVFRLSATPIGKRLSLTMRPPNLSTRIR